MKKISLPQPKIQTRCSALPSLFGCYNSVVNPDKLTEVRVKNGMEGLGTLVHDAIQRAVETKIVDFTEIEQQHEPQDIERAKSMFNAGIGVITEAFKRMKNPKFEVEIAFETEKFSVSGHVDILDIRSNGASLVDFKTGRTRDDHFHQMAGYAVGAWVHAGLPKVFTAHVTYVYLEDGSESSFTLDATQLKRWIKQLDNLPRGYTVNRRCIYCRLNDSCPVFTQYVAGSVQFLDDTVEARPNVRAMLSEDRTKLVVTIKRMKDVIERLRQHVKDDVLLNGDMEIGNGDKYTISLQKHRILLPNLALPILSDYATAKEITRNTTLSAPGILASVMARHNGPAKTRVKEEIEKKLQEARAIIITETPQLRTVYSKGKK